MTTQPKKRPGKREKRLVSYLVAAEGEKTSLSAYLDCPAATFLAQVCEANDAFVHCKNKFTKKVDGEYHKDSVDSLRQISCALLATVMGHFETFQKAIFAGCFERSRYVEKFSARDFVRNLEKNSDLTVQLDPARLAAFRGLDAPVGYVIADSLKGWHSPEKVNVFLKAFGLKQQYFATKDVSDLQLLWQLRHSIVHTGAWITIPDAQKVAALRDFADKPVVFEHTFMNALSRRLHKMVQSANQRLEKDFVDLLGSSPHATEVADVTAFLKVTSPTMTWLK